MEYEDLHNKVKASQSAAILVLKTGDLSFIFCSNWQQSKV